MNDRKWNGTDLNGNFHQTYIHDYGDGTQVMVGTAKQHAIQMGFKELEDMYDFLNNKKRRR